MKTLFFFLVSLTLVLFTARTTQAGQQSDQCVVTIILDTSPTSNWSQIRKAAENIYKASFIGNTVLLFAVRGGDTQLLFSCVKRRTDDELDSFYSALRAITADWFIKADLANALNGPIYEKLLQHAGQQGQAIIVILSEGDLSHEQASDVCKFAEQIKAAHHWPLLLTGTVEKTAREFLIAAGKGHLNWCKLADAADRAFIEKLLQKIKPIAEKVTATQPTAATHKETTPFNKDTPETVERLSPKVQEPHASAEPNDVASTHLSGPSEKSPARKEASGKEAPEPNLASESNVFKPQSSVAR
ncbi:MAG: hypothetical protein NTX52_11870, partial [Planctomycetota bacterium]|nr:hypothetical protein [Planctomycetota bacterium]